MENSSCTPTTNESLVQGIFENGTFFNCSANNTTSNTSVVHDWAYPLGASIFLIIDTCISSTWIVLANTIVISSFLRDSKLRIVQNYYIFSLAISDWMMGAFVMTLGLYQFLYQAWPNQNRSLCKFWNAMDFINSLQSSLSICLISYDRYKMVLHPIAYRNEETPKRAVMRIVATWIFSFLFYGPVTIFWDIWQGYSIIPIDMCDVEFRNVVPLTITQACVEFLAPLLVICFCNISLLLYIRKRRRRLVDIRKAMETGGVDTTSEGNSKLPKDEEKVAEKAKNKTEIQEIRKEQKATRSLLILVGTFFCLWFWYEIIGNFVDPICNCVSNEVYEASYWPQYHISGIDPLIYALTIERFTYHFKVFFSYVIPCCVRHPDKVSKVGPASTAGATSHHSSS